MKLKWLTFICVFFIGLFSNSCSVAPCGGSPAGLIKKVESLVGKVEARQKKLTADEWKQYDGQFRQLVDDCYDDFESEMTSKEQNKFWKACYKYSRLRIKNGFFNLFKKNKGYETSDFKDFMDASKKYVKDLKLDEDIKEIKAILESEFKSFE